MPTNLLHVPVAPPSGAAVESIEPEEASVFPMTLLDVFTVALAGALVVGNAVRLGSVAALWDWPALLVILVAMPTADFISGCIHWFFDTWGDEKTFFIGTRMIKPFRVHHDKPQNLLGTHFFSTNADASMANIPMLALALCLPLDWQATQLLSLLLAATAFFGLPTSQIHKWSHMARPPRLVAWLQNAGLILGRRHHNVHHTPPHTDYYCITTGWCNPLLTRLGFWRRLERVIRGITGWAPRAHEDGHVQVLAPGH
jgi:hypothetical protein